MTVYIVGSHIAEPPAPKRRLPEPAHRWPLALAAAALLVVAAALLARPANADDTGDAPRFTPASRGSVDQVERWRGLVEQYDWNADTALAVIRCESKGDPAAVNPSSGAQGLWQIMPDTWQRLANTLHGAWVSLFEPSVNTRTAYALYEAFGGWSPWAASRACWSGGW